MDPDRRQVGVIGEALCSSELKRRGWEVVDLNLKSANHPNSDVQITKGNVSHYLQIKTSAKLASMNRGGYVTGGSVNPSLFSGCSIFNRSTRGPECQFVIFISEVVTKPRYFVVPVEIAERMFRRNIDAYFLSPKLNGGVKSLRGQADIFVGGGECPHARIVPDQRSEIIEYENLWTILE